MRTKFPKLKSGIMALSSVLLFTGAGLLQSCDNDLLTGQPSWLGNSIYDELKSDGHYNITLQLIEDLGQDTILSHTGSRTLFAADDEAYARFFQNNTWGVKEYKDLTQAQKKMLLYSSIINNAYLVELLSNVSGNPPTEGMCMRRESAFDIYDTVSVVDPLTLPDSKEHFWRKLRSKNHKVVLMHDQTSQPMIHFLPAYMKLNKITDNDLKILTNGVSNSTADAWVNGKKIVERDITCKNGYIHKVDGVMTSADNMADIIHSHANMKTFSQLLDRFSYPEYDDEVTKQYNRLYNNNDSVFALRYFAEQSPATHYSIGTKLSIITQDRDTVSTLLSFDPGWNHYIYSNTAGYDLHYDAGAMLVPTNTALETWWNNDGKVLQDMYGTWDNVPMDVLLKLVNINLVNSFSETVPSKFENIVDNATKVSLGIKPENVDSCFMGCNGVVYLTNKVFTPAEYRSVTFPALINTNTMDIIYWAIENCNFEPYLNSMDSYYSFILPTNSAMLTYLDPCSYAASSPIIYQFYKSGPIVRAHRRRLDGRELPDASSEQVKNRLTDLLNNLIIVGDVEDGHTYYKTKGGSTIKVTRPGQEGSMLVQGGYQIDRNESIVVPTIYDQTGRTYDQNGTGNGKAYVVESQLPLNSTRSTYSVLKATPAFSTFFNLLNESKLAIKKLGAQADAIDYNISLFDAYNYTVYVPTNASIQALIDNKQLPSWNDYHYMDSLVKKDYGTAAEKEVQTAMRNRIENFLRYHIQDNSVFIDGAPQDNILFESSKINPENKRFFSLTVSADRESLSVSDQLKNQRKVIKTGGLYNIMARDAWIERMNSTESDRLYNASEIVIHQIDGPLFYSSTQLTSWVDEVNAILAKYNTNNAKAYRMRRR